jgi:predicted DNA-binding protein YlxM (UPF0122 family)
MPFNMKGYLDNLVKAGAVSDEQRKALEVVFKDDNKGLVEFLENNQRMQSDYSRSMDELKTEKQQLDVLKDQLLTNQQRLAQLEPGWSAEKQKILNENAGLKTRMAEMRIKAESKYDVTDDFMKDIFGDEQPSQQPPAQAATSNGGFNAEEHLKGYVREEQVNGRAAEILRFSTWLMKRQREHQKLFGDYFDEDELLAEIAKAPNDAYDAVYDRKYNASAKRKEIEEAAINQRITDGVRDGVQKAMLGQTMEGAHRRDNDIQSQVFIPPATGEAGADNQPDNQHLSRSLELWDKVDQATGGA